MPHNTIQYNTIQYNTIQFTGVLSYADNITLMCPSLRGMNCMLKKCSEFAKKFR